jgi:hypothetical protein
MDRSTKFGNAAKLLKPLSVTEVLSQELMLQPENKTFIKTGKHIHPTLYITSGQMVKKHMWEGKFSEEEPLLCQKCFCITTKH